MGRAPKGRCRSSSTSPSFFKVLIDDFRKKLHLPKAFVKNFNGRVPKKIILKSCTRRSWIVSTKIVGNDVFLCDEWRNFVKDHALQCGEIVVFRYDGNSEFRVIIFGRNKCKRDISSAMTNNGESVQTKEIYLKEERRAMTNKMNSTSIRPNAMSRKKERSKKLEVDHSFTTTLKKSHKYRIAVPRRLVIEQDLAKLDNIVLLDQCGRSWQVKILRRGNGESFLGNGWYDFSVANKINTGDTCRFEFMANEMGNAAIVVVTAGESLEAHTARHAKTAQDISHHTCPELPKKQHGEFVPRRLFEVQEKERAIARAGFASDNPFCSVSLRSTYVRKNSFVVLPHAFSRKYLKGVCREVTLQVLHGGSWNVRYSGEPYHRLVGGWKSFVLDNHLKENDVCIFEFVDTNHIKLKVSIICN